MQLRSFSLPRMLYKDDSAWNQRADHVEPLADNDKYLAGVYDILQSATMCVAHGRDIR